MTATARTRCTARPAPTTAAPRCTCRRHTIATQAACRYQVMNTARLFPVLAAIGEDYAAMCERNVLPALPTATGDVEPADLGAYLTCALTDEAERDMLWRTVVGPTREPGKQAQAWKLAALALALPRLIHIALRARGRESARDTEAGEVLAEMLASFTEALATIDLTPDAADPVLWRLARAATAGAQRAVDRAAAQRRRRAEISEQPEDAACPRTRPSHPDLALARLVAAGVIDAAEAELIGRHRIEQVTLRQICVERGWYPMQGTRALRAAEAKVARALDVPEDDH